MIIDDIRNEKNFQDDLSEINLFIGIKPYSQDSSRDAKELVITNFNNTLYEISEGHIAFIPEKESYPSSFLFLIKMLFDDFEMAIKIFEHTNSKNLTIYLYNKHYMFINLSNINMKKFKNNIKKFKTIFICGLNGHNDKRKEVEKIANDNNIEIVNLCHPSGMNIGKTKFTNQWFKHDNGNAYDLKQLIISKKDL